MDVVDSLDETQQKQELHTVSAKIPHDVYVRMRRARLSLGIKSSKFVTEAILRLLDDVEKNNSVLIATNIKSNEKE